MCSGPWDIRNFDKCPFGMFQMWMVVSKARICTEVHPWACHQWSGLWRRSQEDPWCFGTEIRWFINLFAMKLVCLFDHQPSHFVYFLNDDCNFFSIKPTFLGNGSRKAFVWDFSKGMVGSRVAFEVWRNPWCWSVVLCQRLLCREPWHKRSGVQGVVATQQPKRSREVPLVKLQDLTQIVANYFVCMKLACKIMPPRYQCLVTFFSMSWYIDKNVNHERNTLVDWWI